MAIVKGNQPHLGETDGNGIIFQWFLKCLCLGRAFGGFAGRTPSSLGKNGIEAQATGTL
jgi:hypothetical protein